MTHAQSTLKAGNTDLLEGLRMPGRVYGAMVVPIALTSASTTILHLALDGRTVRVRNIGFYVSTAVTDTGTPPTITFSKRAADGSTDAAGYFIASYSVDTVALAAEVSVLGADAASFTWAATADTAAERILADHEAIIMVVAEQNCNAGAIIPWVDLEWVANGPQAEPVNNPT